MRKYLFPIALAALLSGTALAVAANSSGNFTARITIVAGCNVSAGDLNFPNTSTIAGTENTTSTVTVKCTKSTPYALSLTNVTLIASATTTAAGTMTNTVTPTETIAYNIDFVGSSVGTGTGANQTHTLRGTLATQNTPVPGSYLDARSIYVVY